MTARPVILAGLLAVLPALAHAEDKPDYRKFTNDKGVEISAVVVDKTDTEVTFLLENGRRATTAIASLSEEDQEYVRGWSKAKAVFLEKCRGLTVRQLLDLRGYESFPFRLENNSIVVDGKLNDTTVAFIVNPALES